MASLYIVGTPIGNLKDITLRALETLRVVDIIACEDTRVTKKLLFHYDILGKKLISYHDKNEKNSSKGIIQLVQDGKNIALVSDAGMPVVSDPGFILIRECKKANIDIKIIPGVSAQVCAFALSSFSNTYTFLGFLSPKTGTMKNQINKLIKGTYVIYVSPHKLITTLKSFEEIFKNKIKLFICKELTKLNETFWEGTPEELLSFFSEKIKGEYTIVFKKP